MYMKFCKDLLGVQIRTTNAGVMLELGQLPLYIYGKKNFTKNWNRICRQGNANELLLSSCQNTMEKDWKSSVKTFFTAIHLNFEDTPTEDEQAPSIQVFNREQESFQNSVLNDMNESSKPKTLSLVKSSLVIEDYLLSVPSLPNRTY